MEIDKIKKLANDRYKIIFINEESLITYDEVIIKYNLLYKKEIDNSLYEQILLDNKYYDSYNKCIKLISNKMRSVYEIESYLKKEEVSNKDIKSIIDKLTKIGLLNDLRYTKSYISDKMKFTNAGPFKIEVELRDKGIDETIISDEINKIDRIDIINKISKYIDNKLKKNKCSEFIFKQKVITELLSMGYNKEDIIDKLDNVKIESNVIKDYEKLYKKLSLKYEGDTLNYQIKNKLYQKGYTKDEIDSLKKLD